MMADHAVERGRPGSPLPDRASDRQGGTAFVGPVGARLAVQAAHTNLAAAVVQGDDLPQPGVEDRRAGAAALGGRAVVHATHAGDWRGAQRRAFVIDERVVLERKRQLATPG